MSHSLLAFARRLGAVHFNAGSRGRCVPDPVLAGAYIEPAGSACVYSLAQICPRSQWEE